MIRSFVTTLSGSEPIVEVPIDDADSPNVFVSVLAVRGRVGSFFSWLSDMARRFNLPDFVPRDGGRPTALIDLSKPSYRLGAAEIRVGWKPHRLDVHVTADRASFAVREQAHVKIHVARADGKTLAGRRGSRACRGRRSAARTRAEPELESARRDDGPTRPRGVDGDGADGGDRQTHVRPQSGAARRRRRSRTRARTVRYAARLAGSRDARRQRRREATIPLNDSLTSFRIVAVANAGGDLFGTGSTNDRHHAGSAAAVRVCRRSCAKATGIWRRSPCATPRPSLRPCDAVARTTPPLQSELPTQQFDIAAGAARDIVWDVTAPYGANALAWDVSLEAGGGARDRIAVSQKLIAAVPVRTFQATLAQLDPTLSFTAERPADAIPGRGGLDVSLQARLGDRLDGVRDYMERYPYVCLEQQLSKAVALRDAAGVGSAGWRNCRRISTGTGC